MIDTLDDNYTDEYVGPDAKMLKMLERANLAFENNELDSFDVRMEDRNYEIGTKVVKNPYYEPYEQDYSEFPDCKKNYFVISSLSKISA